MTTASEKSTADGELHLAATPIRVLIADDHPMVIAGIRRTIEHLDDIEIVGEAHSGPELMQLIERRTPGLVLLDLRMPGVVGFECIERIRQSWPEIKTVVLSACDDRASIDGALLAGASAYVVKTAAALDVASVLREASSGAVFHAPSYAPSPVGLHIQPDLPALTDRERTILSAIVNRTGAVRFAFEHDLVAA